MPAPKPPVKRPAATSRGGGWSESKSPAGCRRGTTAKSSEGRKKDEKGASNKKAADKKGRVSPARSEPRDKSRDKEEKKTKSSSDKGRKSEKETKDSKESKDKNDKKGRKFSTEREERRRDEEEDDDVDEDDGDWYREEGEEEGDAVAVDEEFDPDAGKVLKRRKKIVGC